MVDTFGEILLLLLFGNDLVHDIPLLLQSMVHFLFHLVFLKCFHFSLWLSWTSNIWQLYVVITDAKHEVLAAAADTGGNRRCLERTAATGRTERELVPVLL